EQAPADAVRKRSTPPQFAATEDPTRAAPPNFERTVAFEAAPEAASRKKRSFGGTIAFGAERSPDSTKARSQTMAFEATGANRPSSPPTRRGGPGATMAFEAPRLDPPP